MALTLQRKIPLSSLIKGSLLLVGIVPLISISLLLTSLTRSALEDSAYSQLNSTRSIKSKQVETYFEEREADLTVLSNAINAYYQQSQAQLTQVATIKSKSLRSLFQQIERELTLFSKSYDTLEALKAFNSSFSSDQETKNNARWRIHRDIFGPHVNSFKEAFDWYDAYLISPNGDIIYSALQDVDLGLNILGDNMKSTALQNAFKQAQNTDGNIFSDLEQHRPTGQYAAFMLRKVFDSEQRVLGYVALQLPLSRVNQIMSRDTMSESSIYSYLVGHDSKLRSDTPFISLLKSPNYQVSYDLLSLNKVGQPTIVRNQQGNLSVVISEVVPVSHSVNWTLVTEMSVDAALVPTMSQNESYYDHYLKEYGYYDLFLIHPEGDIFYTVAKESDYQTNILSGKYSSSNLGKLIQTVSSTLQFEIADFEPYAPSFDAPSSFIAIPVLNRSKEPVIFVALQLSLDSINTMMQLREGMGETGETYLVGDDFKMRSDSFLDPSGHSVSASFAGSVDQNGVQTKASQSALGGSVGTEQITDYNGNQVLSSYSPIQIGDTRWAVIAEIDVAEAFRAIDKINYWLVIGVIFTLLITVALALFISRLIIKPLGGEPRDMMELANRIASGDLSYQFKHRGHEGSVYASLQSMSTSLSSLIGHITQSSQELASTAEQASIASEQTTTAVTNQQTDTEMIAAAVNQMSSTVAEVASNTESVALITKEAHQKSLDGMALLEKSVLANKGLMSEMTKTSSNMKNLLDETQQIDQVLSVIQTIAEQTNLLALNAAIEAARAGENGRGFAVVADEVRQLASKTQQSTTDIQKIITSVKQATQESSDNMSTSVSQAETANRLSQETVSAFKAINEAVERIDEMMSQISTAAEEQAHVSDDINRRISHISTVSTETSVSAQELSAASQEVARAAEGLLAQTKRFSL